MTLGLHPHPRVTTHQRSGLTKALIFYNNESWLVFKECMLPERYSGLNKSTIT